MNYFIAIIVAFIPSFIAGVLVVFIDRRYTQIWDRWKFRKLKHEDKNFSGIARMIYDLEGKHLESDGKEEKSITLGEIFSRPNDNDPKYYKLSGVDIRVNRSRELKFSGFLHKKEDTNVYASIEGEGDFISKDENNFEGFASINCVMTQQTTGRTPKRSWTVTCLLNRISTKEEWRGYWILLDRTNPEQANFGTIELSQPSV